MLTAALSAGLCASGVDVDLTGVIPTPGIAYLTRTEGYDAGHDLCFTQSIPR